VGVISDHKQCWWMSSENSFPGKAGHVQSATLTSAPHPSQDTPLPQGNRQQPIHRQERVPQTFTLKGRTKQNKTKNPASLSFCWLEWVSTKLCSSTKQPLHFHNFSSTGTWTQGLHLQPLHQPFFVMVFFRDQVCLALNCYPPDFCLLSS
jgi:hypothetical protein